MMDQSFDPFNGGYGGNAGGYGADTSMVAGGNDASFFGTQAAPKVNEYEKVCLPVTVATLNTIEQDQKIQFGNYTFSTVRVVGQVIQTVDRPDGGAQTHYHIRDCNAGEDQDLFTVIVYHGVDGQKYESFIEGTIISAVGKVNTFDNKTVVVAFKVLEVFDMGVRDVFPKEARLAELYFSKNVPEMYQSGNIGVLMNTMLSPEAPASNNKAAAAGTPARTALPANTHAGAANSSTVYQSTQGRNGRGANPQQNKIIEYLTSFGQNEEGQDFETIRKVVRGDANFEEDMNALASNGVIYTTISAKVEIVGCDNEGIQSVVSGLESFHKTVESAEPGDQLGILLRGLGPKDVRRGCVLVPQGHKHAITDRVKAQLYVLKPDEGGSKMPLANYFSEHVFSLTWDTGATMKILGKDFIMPGEHAEIELLLNQKMFIEPQQRFTIRQGQTTIGTGVFVENLPRQTEAEKDPKQKKKLMKAEMERLGFNPYGELMEKRLKPDYSNSPKDNPIAKEFEATS